MNDHAAGGGATRTATGPATPVGVKNHPLVNCFIRRANEHLAAQGFTEHGFRHANLVSHMAHNVLHRLYDGRPDRERLAALAEIAGYTHDIGNVVARANHGPTGGAIMAPILWEMGMDPDEIATVVGAIGNHEEETGQPVNPVSAALILADKSDVHRSRVHNRDLATFDIHDRVNYAVSRSFLNVDPASRQITLELTIDTEICPVMEYFEIFLSRMLMCRRAGEFLECRFRLRINEVTLL